MPDVSEYILGYAKENKALVTGYVLLLAGTTVVSLVGITKSVASLYQAASSNDRSRAFLFLAIIIGLTLLAFLMQFAVEWLENIMDPTFKQYVMGRAVDSIFVANDSQYLDILPMKYRAYVRNTADAARNVFNKLIRVYLPNIILLVVLLVFLLVLHWSYGTMFVVGGAAALCFLLFNIRQVLVNSEEVERRRRYADFFVFDVLQALPTVVSSGTTEMERENIDAVLAYGTRATVTGNQTFMSFAFMVNSVLLVTIFIVMYLAVNRLGTEGVSVDKIVTALSLMTALKIRMETLGETNATMIEQIGKYTGNGLATVENTPPSTGTDLICDKACKGGGNGVKERCPVKIDFEDVRFRYPGTDRFVIKDFNWSMGPGVNCLRAKSGAGKTTLARLMVGLYPCTEGMIRMNGKNVRDVDVNDLRCRVCFTNQDLTLLDRTIREAMAYGSTAAETEIQEVWKSIRHVFEGKTLDDRVGKAGGNCSTGMRQILRLANVELRRASCVVADEPCAALDAKNKKFVIGSLQRLADKGVTLLIITHDDEVAAISTNTKELVPSGE